MLIIVFSGRAKVGSQLKDILARLHVLVIGPGLGREDYMQDYAQMAISIAREQDKYIVLDADGLWLIQNHPEYIKGYRKAVLTPNLVEFNRLCDSLVILTDYDWRSADICWWFAAHPERRA